MKNYQILNILLICCIQSILAFLQNQLPEDAIIVASDGSGDFDTVQSAVDYLPSKSDSERVIFIKNGIYKEQVTIKKNYITFIGEDRDNVIITFDLNNNKTGSSSECATVKALSNNFKAFDITFENTAPFPMDNSQAPAFYSRGQQHYIENCRFLSYQDTLLADYGTQYFKNCYIRGVTDFIWGRGRSVFENCHMHIVYVPKKKKAYITANGNSDENFLESGFLITQSKVTIEDNVKFYLGRLWRKNCYVIFDRTEFPGDKLVANGWLPFKNHEDYTETSKVGEYKCYGPNYSTEGRESYSIEFESVPSISEFLDDDLTFVSDTIYFKSLSKIDLEESTSTTSSLPTVNTTDENNKIISTVTESNSASETTNGNINEPSENCNILYSQCGGIGFTGSTCCKEGICKEINQWYSQCL
ncbi:pectin lyase-like protein, partial [Neocallimastix sp. 'constans']